jgi:adhesin HecA-like repeat protein
MTETEIFAGWEYVADGVMGGVSAGRMTQQTYLGRAATVLRGMVSLDNNGGFVQIATDLRADAPDPRMWDGIAIDVAGNEESYDLRLRTDQLTRPWQSFRTDFVAQPQWKTLRFPFGDFVAHRHTMGFAPDALRRIGILAIGRVFAAEVAVAGLRFYRD